MRSGISPQPYASFLSSARPVPVPRVREPFRYVVAESGESGGASPDGVESVKHRWHTVRQDSGALVPSRIEGVQAVASPSEASPSEMQDQAGSSVLVLIPEEDLAAVQGTVRSSHERMQALTKRLLALGPHRLPEFKAAKAVRDDLQRLRQTLDAKTRSDDAA